MTPASFSVRQVVLVNLAFLVLMLAGLTVSQRIPVDVFPDISFNTATVTTIWPGASAEEVERMVTRKIEDEAREISGIKQWTSFSSQGASSIAIEWQESLSEIEQQAALNELRAAIDRVDDLPADVEPPVLMELGVAEVAESCMIAVGDAGGVGESVLRQIARQMERKAGRLPGVRKAEVIGDRERELRVYVDKNKALQYDLTLGEISAIIARNNQNMPGGSFTSPGAQEINVRGLGNYLSPEQLAETVVRKSPDGSHVTLGEIAEVEPGFARRVFYSYVNGMPALYARVMKESDASVGDVVRAARELVEHEKQFVPEGIELSLVWDSSRFVDQRLGILRSNLFVGIAFVVLILWLTVGFRNALLAIVGVPFSFLTALLLFPVFDITINMLSLIGFVMVSGMLVDDAIIVIENIYRHIEEGEPVSQAVISGTNEVMWPVISAVATTMAAFIPMLLVSGTSGEFMSILPKTVIVCLIASLIECLFVLPAHYLDWGSKRRASEKKERGSSAFSAVARFSDGVRLRTDALIDRARDGYLSALGRVLRNKGAFLAACVAAFWFSCGLSSHVPTDLFPNDFNQLFATVETPIDYGIEQTNEVVLGVQAALDDLGDELTEVTAIVGQGMGPEEQPRFGSNYGLFFISFRETAENNADPGRVLNRVRERLEAHRRENSEGIEALIVNAPRNGPPIGKPVATRIVSEDYDLAKRIAAEIKRELASMPGVFNITDNMPLGKRELQIGLDEYRASLHGLTFEDLGIALRAANDGIVPTTFKDPYSDEDIDIRVLLPESQRRSADELLDVDLRTPEGYLVKLGDVSTVGIRRGFQRLYHYDGQRALVVYADVDTDETSSVLVNQRLAARFADVPARHPGVSLVFGGEYEETNQAFEDMGRAFVIALIAIYAILAAQFRSYLQPLIVMCVIVFAYIGVVIGMYVWDYALSMYVVYAVVGLAGVVVNDSLVLIDFVNRERERGTPSEQAVLVAGRKRFRAVLLTTLTTVAGLLPMAMGISGVSVVFGPFAAAIVVGLCVASGLTLFVVPTLYLGAEALRERAARRLGRRGSPGPVGAPQPS